MSIDLDFKSIALHGYTQDFYNEIPWDNGREGVSYWEKFCDRCISGDGPLTYTQRYTTKRPDPEILAMSDPELVGQLDGLVLALINAGKRRDIERVKRIVSDILEFKDCH